VTRKLNLKTASGHAAGRLDIASPQDLFRVPRKLGLIDMVFGASMTTFSDTPARSSGHARGVSSALAALALALSAQWAIAGPAIDNFEVDGLDVEEGGFEVQLQSDVSFGQPSRKSAVDGAGDLVFDDGTVARQRHALSAEMGLTSYLKLSAVIEFEQERLDEPGTFAEANDFNDLKVDAINVEGLAVLVPREGDGFGLGATVQFERPLEREEQMVVFFGPLLEFASGQWLLTVNPNLVHHFGGAPDEDGIRDDKWDFAYAAQVAYTLSPQWTFAVEAYGTVDRVGNTGTKTVAAELFGDADQHRIGPVVYFSYDLGRDIVVQRVGAGAGEDEDGENSVLTVGLGYFAGLNENTPDGTLKLSVEVEF
jgi:hypothetical protein